MSLPSSPSSASLHPGTPIPMKRIRSPAVGTWMTLRIDSLSILLEQSSFNSTSLVFLFQLTRPEGLFVRLDQSRFPQLSVAHQIQSFLQSGRLLPSLSKREERFIASIHVANRIHEQVVGELSCSSTGNRVGIQTIECFRSYLRTLASRGEATVFARALNKFVPASGAWRDSFCSAEPFFPASYFHRCSPMPGHVLQSPVKVLLIQSRLLFHKLTPLPPVCVCGRPPLTPYTLLEEHRFRFLISRPQSLRP